MDGFSILNDLSWEPDAVLDHPAYHAGNALGWLYRGNKQASTNHFLSGRLYLAKSGWLLLAVPNALVRGVYDALTAPGAELPTAGIWGTDENKELLNAHISVMTADEVNKIGADKINERGHTFHYSLGALKEITPKTANLSRVWAIQVASPSLAALRKSYGLTPLLNGDHAFHITVAVRRKGVLLNNSTSKSTTDAVQETSRGELKAASADKATYDCNCSGACTCPETCTCKQHGRCGTVHKAAEFSRSGAKLSRSGQNDLLPGGKADNLPDREISLTALSEGAKHEHEHTNNDQIAKEIAKDHLHEDPAYYKKVKQIEKTAKPWIVQWATKRADSVYMNQAFNALNTRQPIRYDHNKPVHENIRNQLAEMKRRGDFIMQTRRNHEMYMSALSPQHRYQRMMQAFHGQLPRQNLMDTTIERYGDQALGYLGGNKP
jgi:hypothetical protein